MRECNCNQFLTFFSTLQCAMVQVVQFIRKLESDGVAYATPSGVYFDTLRFSESHSFKMAPAFEDGLEGR